MKKRPGELRQWLAPPEPRGSEPDRRPTVERDERRVHEKTSAHGNHSQESHRRVLVEQASDGVFVEDTSGRFVDVNASGCRMLGYERDEILELGIQDLIPAEDLDAEPVHFEEYRCGETVIVERRFRRKDGSMIPVEISVNMLSTGQLLGIVRDITKRKVQEQELRQSRDMLQALLKHLPCGVSLVSDGRIVFVNPAAAEMYGYAPEDFLGKKPADFLEGDEAPIATRRVGEISTGGPPYPTEYRCRRADGTVFPVEVTSRLFDFGGRPALLSTHRDLTEKKRLEKELLEVSAREQLRIGQDLHDDLCQRLAGIAFLSKAVAQRLETKSLSEARAVAEITQEVNQAITRTRHLSRGLCHAALQNGGFVTALDELGANMERLYRASFTIKAEGVPCVDDDETARHLYYVAQEAMTNAVKHGRANKVELHVVGRRDRGSLSIWDDGVGLTEDLEHSKGMGVRIMRHRAQMIRASFSIAPVASGGTVVSLTWPRVTRERDD